MTKSASTLSHIVLLQRSFEVFRFSDGELFVSFVSDLLMNCSLSSCQESQSGSSDSPSVDKLLPWHRLEDFPKCPTRYVPTSSPRCRCVLTDEPFFDGQSGSTFLIVKAQATVDCNKSDFVRYMFCGNMSQGCAGLAIRAQRVGGHLEMKPAMPNSKIHHPSEAHRPVLSFLVEQREDLITLSTMSRYSTHFARAVYRLVSLPHDRTDVTVTSWLHVEHTEKRPKEPPTSSSKMMKKRMLSAVKTGTLDSFQDMRSTRESQVFRKGLREVAILPALFLEAAQMQMLRAEEVDNIRCLDFVQDLATAPPPLVPDPTTTSDCYHPLASIVHHDDNWTRVPGTVMSSVTQFCRPGSISKVVATIDLPAADVLARLWLSDLNEHVDHQVATVGCSYPRDAVFDPTKSNRLVSRVFIRANTSTTSSSSKVLSFTTEATLYRLGNDSGAFRIDVTTLANADFPLTSASCPHSPTNFQALFIVTQMTPTISTLTVLTKIASRARQRITFDIADKMQSKFVRPDVEVDGEIRAALCHRLLNMPPITDSSQTTVLEHSRSLLTLKDSCEAIDISRQSQSAMTPMWVLKDPTRRVNVGHAISTLDCSALEVAAWLFLYDSRVRRHFLEDEMVKARFELLRLRENDSVVCTLFRVLSVFSIREQISRLVIAPVPSSPGTWDVAFSSSHIPAEVLPVDYGFRYEKYVPIKSVGLCRAEPLSPSSCSVTFMYHADPGGWCPPNLVNAYIPAMLSLLEECRQAFQIDDEVDHNERIALATIMSTYPEDAYSDEEKNIINDAVDKFKKFDDDKFISLNSPDPNVQMHMTPLHSDTSSSISSTLRSSQIVDADFIELVAFEFLSSSCSRYSKQRRHDDPNFVSYWNENVNEHSAVFSQVKILARGVTPRQFSCLGIWQRLSDNEFAVCYSTEAPAARFVQDSQGCIRATVLAVYFVKRLPNVGAVPQCLFTSYLQIDLKGWIPPTIVNIMATSFLSSDCHIHRYYDRSGEVDEHYRAGTITTLQADQEVYTIGENDIIRKGLAMFELFTDNVSAKKVKMLSPLAEGKLARSNGSVHWGYSTTIIRAKAEEIVAYYFKDYECRNERSNPWIGHAVEVENSHDALVSIKMTLANPISDRMCLQRSIFKKVNADIFIVVKTTSDREDPNWPSSSQSVRVDWNVAIKVVRIGLSKCKVTYCANYDARDDVPLSVLNSAKRILLDPIVHCQEYFQNHRILRDWDHDDGKAVGTSLCLYKVNAFMLDKESRGQYQVRQLHQRMIGFREVIKKYSWMEVFLASVIDNVLRPAIPTIAKLNSLSKRDGRIIGRALASSLATSAMSASAVDEWIAQYPALSELDKAEPWFRPLVTAIAEHLLLTVPWGTQMRVAVGSILSLSDLLTDILCLFSFAEGGSTFYTNALIIMLIGSIFLQVVLCAVQNSKLGIGVIARESLAAVFGVKLVLDSYRVATVTTKQPGKIMSPLHELTCSKVIEVVVESIPATILQIHSILNAIELNRQLDLMAFTSCCVSIACTGYISASLSYEMDVEPAARRRRPDFYGYVRDESNFRFALIFFMWLLSSAHCASKALTIVLLVESDISFLWKLFAVDFGFLLLLKVMRQDFSFWMILSENASLQAFLTMIVRIFEKLMVDFSAFLDFRDPLELGGLYFSTTLIISHTSMYLALFQYHDRSAVDILWVVAVALTSLWTIGIAGVIICVKPDKRSTFWSTTTAPEYLTRQFRRENASDYEKLSVLATNSAALWKKSLHDDIVTWLADGLWEEWSEISRRPEWLSEEALHCIPEDIIAEVNDRIDDEYSESDTWLDVPNDSSVTDRSSNNSSSIRGTRRTGKATARNSVLVNAVIKESLTSKAVKVEPVN